MKLNNNKKDCKIHGGGHHEPFPMHFNTKHGNPRLLKKFFLRSNRLCFFSLYLPSCRDILQTMTQPPPRAPWHVFTRKDAAKKNEVKLLETRSLSYFLLKMDPRLPLLPSPSPPVMSRRWRSAYTRIDLQGAPEATDNFLLLERWLNGGKLQVRMSTDYVLGPKVCGHLAITTRVCF